MDVFINEYSLSGQYPDISAFEKGIRQLINCISILADIKNNRNIQYTGTPTSLLHDIDSIKLRLVSDNSIFIQSINRLHRDLQNMFFGLLQTTNAKNWRIDQQHNNDEEYLCSVLGCNVCGYSPAEAAERQLMNPSLPTLLINFIDSPYAKTESSTITKSGTTIDIAYVESEAQLIDWINRTYNIFPYTGSESYPPRDNQTVLREGRFEKTSRVIQGRSVYREGTTGNFFYVDNRHSGRGAHLEVFDAHGNHLGEANIFTGTINAATQERDRRI